VRGRGSLCMLRRVMAGEETVIIAYDGSAAAREALAAAAKLLSGCHILVVTVWEAGLAYMMPTAPAEGMMMTQPVNPMLAHDLDATLKSEAERVAREGAEAAASLGLDAEPLSVPDARDVARTVIDMARERRAAAIVVGSRGLSGVRARLEGSTSKGLLAHAPCPVLVVHASD
jgi:nucleotide-binding universal stress UspA family protein